MNSSYINKQPLEIVKSSIIEEWAEYCEPFVYKPFFCGDFSNDFKSKSQLELDYSSTTTSSIMASGTSTSTIKLGLQYSIKGEK